MYKINHDVVTGEINQIELSLAEIADFEKAVAKADLEREKSETEASAKAQAKTALLQRLGITADEAALLLS
jgi:hypothetical protein